MALFLQSITPKILVSCPTPELGPASTAAALPAGPPEGIGACPPEGITSIIVISEGVHSNSQLWRRFAVSVIGPMVVLQKKSGARAQVACRGALPPWLGGGRRGEGGLYTFTWRGCAGVDPRSPYSADPLRAERNTFISYGSLIRLEDAFDGSLQRESWLLPVTRR
ncbi:unnamed protein product, partial [Iphiclides podalirius]